MVDPYTGDVVAMVGGTGAKDGGPGLELGHGGPAAAVLPPSPSSVYAPALDNGTITAASAIDDYPVRDLPGYGAWPSELRHAGFRRPDHRL